MLFLLVHFLCALSMINAVPCSKNTVPIIKNVVPIINMVDMTYVYDETIINHPLWKKFEMSVIRFTKGPSRIQGENISTATHMGTHMDAPSHFSPGGLNIDQIPISKLIAPAAVINIKSRAARDRDAQVRVKDLENWERTTGQSLDGKVVLMNSGWGKKWPNKADYLGTAEDDASKLRNPGFSREACQWLVDNKNILGIGVDTISLDAGINKDSPAHNIILGNGLYGLECVANMDKIPIFGANLLIMPMKICDASGAPARVIAFL